VPYLIPPSVAPPKQGKKRMRYIHIKLKCKNKGRPKTKNNTAKVPHK
jgi:hypothetical protein